MAPSPRALWLLCCATAAGLAPPPATAAVLAPPAPPRRYAFTLPLDSVCPARLRTRSFNAGGHQFYVDALVVEDRTALYLRYEPLEAGDEVDCTFSLTLKADGEVLKTTARNGGSVLGGGDSWQGSMTLCDKSVAHVSNGRARDWGANAWPASDAALTVELEIDVWRSSNGTRPWRSFLDEGRALRSGAVVVPVAQTAEAKSRLAAAGIFQGREYRLMALHVNDERAFRGPRQCGEETRLTLRPAFYDDDSRDWPVDVSGGGVDFFARSAPLAAAPRGWAELLRLSGGKPVAAFGLAWLWLSFSLAPIPAALVARGTVSLYAIPSESMAPALRSGDVLLVTKHGIRVDVGDIVVFKPPPELGDIVRRASPDKIGASFVKRVAAVSGDSRPAPDDALDDARRAARAEADGGDADSRKLCSTPTLAFSAAVKERAATAEPSIAPNSIFVRGDCSAVSVDSRIWGDLPVEDVVGKPILRVWPPSRAGRLKS
ncbi:peptidase S24/S26A/S26B/S26C [Pelagophyceae sp. CCMP2097]|nr:peptidase S24/S26A/S26B/S26C [Pelagophyceae sp. CCMP2097]